MKSIVYGVVALSALIAAPGHASVMRQDASTNATSAVVERLTDGTLASEAKAVYERLSQPTLTSSAPVNPLRVPEPGTIALVGVGLAGIRLLRRRKP